MLQTAVINGVSFDPFPFSDDGIIAPKVDICGRDIIEVHEVRLNASRVTMAHQERATLGHHYFKDLDLKLPP